MSGHGSIMMSGVGHELVSNAKSPRCRNTPQHHCQSFTPVAFGTFKLLWTDLPVGQKSFLSQTLRQPQWLKHLLDVCQDLVFLLSSLLIVEVSSNLHCGKNCPFYLVALGFEPQLTTQQLMAWLSASIDYLKPLWQHVSTLPTGLNHFLWYFWGLGRLLRKICIVVLRAELVYGATLRIPGEFFSSSQSIIAMTHQLTLLSWGWWWNLLELFHHVLTIITSLLTNI